jgi:hypothetical protein
LNFKHEQIAQGEKENRCSVHRFVIENGVEWTAGWTRIQKSWVYCQILSLIGFMSVPLRKDHQACLFQESPRVNVSSKFDEVDVSA